MTIKIKLLKCFYNLITCDFFSVEELKNTRTGGYGMKSAWKGRERKDPEKQDKQKTGNLKKTNIILGEFLCGQTLRLQNNTDAAKRETQRARH